MRIATIGNSKRVAAHRRALSDLAEVVDPGQGVHAVSLCCEPKDQARMAYGVLHKGVPVLADVPVATSWGELELVLREADRVGAAFLPTTWMRLTPAAQLARDAIFHGTIGRVQSIDIHVPGEPSLVGSGFHGLDLAQFFLHRFESVSARGCICGREIQIEGEDGTPCTVVMGEWRQNFAVIRGRRGVIEIGWRESHIHRDGAGSIWIGEEVDEEIGLRLVAERFVKCVADGAPPWTGLADLSHLADALRAAELPQGDEVAVPLAA